jgi:hypothetical protein
VASLVAVRPSPHRAPDGELTPEGAAGRALFAQLGCARCHGGADFSDSATGALHDVGTLGPGSGGRLGQPLTGIDTPTLRGIWETAPYLHDGSAATLEELIESAAPAHGGMSALGVLERAQLAAYLRQIDASEPAPAPLHAAPQVDAGPSLSVPLGHDAWLEGWAGDDGEPGPLALGWSQQGGPAPARFASPEAAGTRVQLDAPGIYVLRLSADDGELSAYDDVVVVVRPAPPAPP